MLQLAINEVHVSQLGGGGEETLKFTNKYLQKIMGAVVEMMKKNNQSFGFRTTGFFLKI